MATVALHVLPLVSWQPITSSCNFRVHGNFYSTLNDIFLPHHVLIHACSENYTFSLYALENLGCNRESNHPFWFSQRHSVYYFSVSLALGNFESHKSWHDCRLSLSSPLNATLLPRECSLYFSREAYGSDVAYFKMSLLLRPYVAAPSRNPPTVCLFAYPNKTT
jgi:hypothetical protein